MLVKTILNHIQKYSSFVYGDATLYKREENLILDIGISPRKNSRPVCSKCGVHGPVYDHMPTPRRFEYIPIWGIRVFFVYTMRRVDCPTCGVTIESVPWGDGKRQTTTTYSRFPAYFAKKLSWVEVAKTFKTSWANVYFAVEMAVEWGRKNLNLSDVTAIGIDEILWHLEKALRFDHFDSFTQ
jgi:transposase